MNNHLKLLLITMLLPSLAQSIIPETAPGFYVAELPDRAMPGLRLVLERVTENNYDSWRHYAYNQAHLNVQKIPGFANRYDGTSLFRDAISDFNPLKASHELWIAYATRTKDPKPNSIRPEIGRPDPESVKNIEMSFTLTTHPQAFITSHVGISMSYENVERQKYDNDFLGKGISIDLHAFAAQIMLQRNQNLRYMINTPASVMEALIMNAVKKTFIGTTQHFAEVKEPMLFPASFKPLYDSLRVMKTKSGQLFSEEDFAAILKSQPPIISMPDKYSMVIFEQDDLQTPWLKINYFDDVHGWILKGEYKPSGNTHYIAVDLLELASKSKAIPLPLPLPLIKPADDEEKGL